MKKLNYFLLGAAGLLLASCSNDDLVAPAAPGDGNVNVTISLPGKLTTRAMNDGYTSTKLYYAVYDADNGNDTFVLEGTANFGANELSATVSMNLANGKSYNIAFFAYAGSTFTTNTDTNAGAVYALNPQTGVMTVNYSNMNATGNANDSYDCFFNVIPTGKIGTVATNISATLYRPIAQINWGTSDLSEEAIAHSTAFGPNLEYLKANLSTNAYNTFDFLTGDVTGDMVDVALNGFNAPEGVAFPVTATPAYEYLAMQYLLAPKSASTVYDLYLTVNNSGNPDAAVIENNVVVANAPVQANYQTNIYGSLLTDNLNVTVTKSPGWAGSYLYVPEADQGTLLYNGLMYNASVKTYTILSEEGLYNYITEIATQNSDAPLAGYTVLLDADLDMNNYTQYGAYTPFYNGGATFDGQGHTIENLTVVATEKNSAGFMTSARGTVQNLNFTNANITGNYKAGVLAGDGLCATINNISVNGATVTSTPWNTGTDAGYDDGNNIGGIVGYLSAEPNASVTNCMVNNAKITAYRKVGGIVGYANGATVQVNNNTVSNSTVTANMYVNGTYDSGKPYTFEAGEIYGGIATGANPTNNTADNVTVLTLTAANNYQVSSLEELGNVLSALTNGSTNIPSTLNNKTFTFAPNTTIDYAGATVDPINFFSSGDYGCTLDGNGLIIKNAVVTGTGNYMGLIQNFSGTIKNITVEGLTVNCTNSINVGFVGYLRGTMQNVSVSNSNFTTQVGGIGALAGQAAGGSTITGCISEGNTIQGGYRAGGIAGYTNEGNVSFNQCTVQNNKITATMNGYTQTAGTIVGQSLAGTTTANQCTVNGNQINGEDNDTIGNVTIVND